MEHENIRPASEEEGRRATASGKAAAQETKEDGDEASKEKSSFFDCNICLDCVNDPVITFCGHLYCWPCIYEWIRNGERPCPVCKSAVTKEKLIPLYGRGNPNQKDPRTTIPERPAGQRSEPSYNPYQGFFGFQGGHHVQFDHFVSVFPSIYGLFQAQNPFIPPIRPHVPSNPPTQEEINRIMLSRILMFMAVMFILFLLLS